jgi:hypothetical protein
VDGRHRPDLWTNDDWYNPGRTMPIRLTAANTGYVPWPLGSAAVVMTQSYPVSWPDMPDLTR